MNILALLLVLQTTPAKPALKFDAPANWAPRTITSAMRVADFTLPRAEGDADDATVTVYFFGGTGGSLQANLDRWVSQMTQPDGKESKDLAKTGTLTSHGFKITTIDLSGTYVAETAPGSGQRFNKPGFRLRAAVLESEDGAKGGPFYVKIIGPAKTVEKAAAAIDSFLKSLRLE